MRTAAWTTFATTLAASCGPPPAAEAWRELVDGTGWVMQPADADPLAGHRPGAVACGEAPWRFEAGRIEIDTRGCNYASVARPASVAVAAGDAIRVTFVWGRLDAPGPAEGHVAVLFSDTVVAEERAAIPGPAEARTITLKAPIALQIGDPVVLHVHNHGANTWQLYELAVRR